MENKNHEYTLSDGIQSLPNSVLCSSIFIEYQLMKEFILFQKQELSHLYIVQSCNSAFEWFGVTFIHNGIYSGKILRFKVLISSSYPNCDAPKVVFDPIPIHPLVNQNNGELNTLSKFSKWNSTNNLIFEVIAFAKSSFEIDESDSLASVLKEKIEKHMGDFNELVIRKTTDDRNFINFTEPENPALIEKLRANLLKGRTYYDQSGGGTASFKGNCNTSISGLSWARSFG